MNLGLSAMVSPCSLLQIYATVMPEEQEPCSMVPVVVPFPSSDD